MVFDSVIVVTGGNVLDARLQHAINEAESDAIIAGSGHVSHSRDFS